MSTRQSSRVRKPSAVAAAFKAQEAERKPAKRGSGAKNSKSKRKKIAPADRKILVLFDVDGTLTVPRQSIKKEMVKFLKELKNQVAVGIVGGSDLAKQKEQVGENVIHEYDYSFSENGLIAYKNGELIHTKSMVEQIGEENLKEFINFVLNYLSTVDCPVKRGTFIEYRTGMLNISPVGRGCSQKERDEFEQYDKEHKIREKMVTVLREKFGEKLGLKFSIGGQISFDVFPKGWDKTYCLQFVEKDFPEIHFFGDKTFEGGNDYEIFVDSRVKGHSVMGWEDTMKQCQELFLKEEEEEEEKEETMETEEKKDENDEKNPEAGEEEEAEVEKEEPKPKKATRAIKKKAPTKQENKKEETKKEEEEEDDDEKEEAKASAKNKAAPKKKAPARKSSGKGKKKAADEDEDDDKEEDEE